MLSLRLFSRSSSAEFLVLVLLFFNNTTNAIKLGLLAGDINRHLNPLSVMKLSHHSPVFININAKSPLTIPPPTLLAKPPPFTNLLDLPTPKIPPPLPLPIIPPLLSKPLLPKIPLLPPLPVLPPVIPALPILPPLFPKLPHPGLLPGLPGRLARKIALKKAIRDLKPIKVPIVPKLTKSLKPNVLEKLLELRRKGSLTTAEFTRFKNLLL